MNDERLSQLLRGLPRESASPHFTGAVLRRLRETAAPSPRRTATRRFTFAAATAAVLALGLASGVLVRDHRERRQVRQTVLRQETLVRLDALEAEKRALEAELRRLTRDARPVIYLDSTPDYDVVLDLARLARQPAFRNLEPRPAGWPATLNPEATLGERR